MQCTPGKLTPDPSLPEKRGEKFIPLLFGKRRGRG
jgi:hypothetical protein